MSLASIRARRHMRHFHTSDDADPFVVLRNLVCMDAVGHLSSWQGSRPSLECHVTV